MTKVIHGARNICQEFTELCPGRGTEEVEANIKLVSSYFQNHIITLPTREVSCSASSSYLSRVRLSPWPHGSAVFMCSWGLASSLFHLFPWLELPSVPYSLRKQEIQQETELDLIQISTCCFRGLILAAVGSSPHIGTMVLWDTGLSDWSSGTV